MLIAIHSLHLGRVGPHDARLMMTRSEQQQAFETLYSQYNDRRWVSPDPLEVVYRFREPADVEVAALLAATLAYGRVAQILRNLDIVLAIVGPHPAAFAQSTPKAECIKMLGSFQHRWTTAEEVASLLAGIGTVQQAYGSLEGCFLAHHRAESGTTLAGLGGMVTALRAGGPVNSLLSDPGKGSACKRLHLFMRWMVREDAVDLGCWKGVRASELVVPLDTHLYRIARAFRLTARKQPNLKCALDVTRAFKRMNPDDPLRYDFSLTRLGIRSDADMGEFIRACRNKDYRTATP